MNKNTAPKPAPKPQAAAPKNTVKPWTDRHRAQIKNKCK